MVLTMISLATRENYFGVWIDSSDNGLYFTIKDDDGTNLVFVDYVYEEDEDGFEYLEVPALWSQGNKSYSKDRCLGWFHTWKEAMDTSKWAWNDNASSNSYLGME